MFSDLCFVGKSYVRFEGFSITFATEIPVGMLPVFAVST